MNREQKPWNCGKCTNTRLSYMRTKDNKIQFKFQCMDCGQRVSENLKYEDVKFVLKQLDMKMSDIPTYDKNLRDDKYTEWYNIIRPYSRDQYNRIKGV